MTAVPEGKRRCSRCRLVKDVDQFPPTHTYCRPCFADYNRARWQARKAFKEQFAKQPLVPLDEPPKPKPKTAKPPEPRVLSAAQVSRKPKKPKAKPKPITVVRKDKPGRPRRNNADLFNKFSKLEKPPEPPALAGTETVEQFLARGGQIQRLPHGATAYRT